MPLYTFECMLHGIMELQVPLSQAGNVFSCPMCEYNRYIEENHDDVGENIPYHGVDFLSWLEHGWSKLADESCINALKRVPDAPMFRVR